MSGVEAGEEHRTGNKSAETVSSSLQLVDIDGIQGQDLEVLVYLDAKWPRPSLFDQEYLI